MTPRGIALAFALSWCATVQLIGCGSDHGDRHDAGSGTGGGGTGGSAVGGGGGCDNRDAGTGGHAGGWDRDPSICCDRSAIPIEMPSRQKVTVTVRNDADADRYVVTDGSRRDCSPYQASKVEGAEVTPVQRTAAVACVTCRSEGCDGTLKVANGFVRLAPGDSWEMSWDARGVRACSSPNPDCIYREIQKGALQPVPPGKYRYAIVAFTERPSWCSAAAEGPTLDCDPSSAGGVTGWTPYGLCDAPADAKATFPSVDFDLPERGDVEVVLPLD